MKKSRKLIAIVATAVLTVVSGSANAYPWAKKLEKSLDRNASPACNWIWYKTYHTDADQKVRSRPGKREYRLHIFTEVWRGSEWSQYSCKDKNNIRIKYADHNGVLHAHDREKIRVNSDYKENTRRHVTSAKRYTSGKHKGCSRSNTHFKVQNQRYHKTWRIGTGC